MFWRQLDFLPLAMRCLLTFGSVLSADVSNIKQATNIALLALSAVLLAGFFYWAGEQERRGNPALIPNSIWRKTKFTTICVMIMCSNAVLNCMELLSSLL